MRIHFERIWIIVKKFIVLHSGMNDNLIIFVASNDFRKFGLKERNVVCKKLGGCWHGYSMVCLIADKVNGMFQTVQEILKQEQGVRRKEQGKQQNNGFYL